MSTDPDQDDRHDSDLTDELPILIDAAALESEDPVALSVADDETGEHTAHFVTLAAHEAESVQALKSDLERRAAKIEELERDIGRLSGRWLEIERHLIDKDAAIADLTDTLASARTELAERSAAEERLAAEIVDRDNQFASVLDQLDLQRADAARARAELEQLQRERETERDEIAKKRAELERQSTVPAAPTEQSLREELDALSSYVTNRHAWWSELESLAANQAQRIAGLEREAVERAARQIEIESLAARETARADGLRAELVAESHRAETLETELRHLRAGSPTTVAERRRAAEQPAQGAADPLAPSQERGAESAVPLAEVAAQLEAELEHKRAELTSERAASRDRQERLTAATAGLDAARRQLAEARADSARIERALIDKDRAVEVRDERIRALQSELDQKLGALKKLDAMDVSLQGLDSKMSERLRRTEVQEPPNTPALICLTSDTPRQYALTKRIFTIGRSSTCDIQILTHFVSREHARLTISARSVVIEDLGSTNGVFVNSVRIERQELRHGDLVTVGETQFRFLETMAH